MPYSQNTYAPRKLPVTDGPLRLAVCISGGGSTLANLLTKIDNGELAGFEIVTVIADRPGIKGLQIAESRGIPTAVVSRKDLHFAVVGILVEQCMKPRLKRASNIPDAPFTLPIAPTTPARSSSRKWWMCSTSILLNPLLPKSFRRNAKHFQKPSAWLLGQSSKIMAVG